LRLHRHGLQSVDAVYRLDQEGLVLRAPVELLMQTGAQQGGDQGRDQEDNSGSEATTISVSQKL
jgi:hypothetical protein